jgi:hypothetical protein
MKPLLLLVLALLAAPPAMAQFYPILAAARYCRLRSLGLDFDTALRMALTENAAPHRNSPMINYSGTTTTLDTAEFVDSVSQLCPVYLRRP